MLLQINSTQYVPNMQVSPFVGNGNSGDVDGTGTSVVLTNPRGACLDPDGLWFYVCTDNGQQCHQIIIATAVVTRIGSSFSFHYPYACIVDSSKNIYVVDVSRVIKISYTDINNGVVVAGNPGNSRKLITI